ncbi:hypothetical protein [Pseudarthrobacter sp. lyk4-40-TYG-27]|uniref:hypothetical protein n=1 Tax=Pseudarthrobacter sp. lyk4-40-TYG-27 TaxID=3040305 RepID=UPI00255323F5|nr:hypothetical protein [Pseudarthrobacter sp. lyk4-40-TYG-27]
MTAAYLQIAARSADTDLGTQKTGTIAAHLVHGIDRRYDPLVGTSGHVTSGISLIEEYFGERLDGELLGRVKSAPMEHLVAFREAARDRGMPSFSTWTEQPLEEEVRQRLHSELASETLLLDHKLPLSARSGLSQLLLLARTVVVADPVWAWVGSLDDRGEWRHGTAWFRDATSPADALVQLLSGLAPLREAIDLGVVQLVRPPAETTIEMNRLFVNPTTRSKLQEAFPGGWGLDHDDLGRDIPGTFSVLTLMSDLDYYFTAEARWEAVASVIFPELKPEEGVPRLRRSIAFDDYTALNGLTPAPSAAVEDFFTLATRQQAESSHAFKLELPIMHLTLADALSMRGTDEVFAVVRSALHETINRVGDSGEGETANEYASRLSSAARVTFADAEDIIRRERSRNWMLGHGLPVATGLAFGVGMKAVGVPFPGGSAAVRSGLGWLLRSRKRRAQAASTALRYVSNVRLSGYL